MRHGTMSDNQASKAERLDAVLRALIKAADSFLQSTNDDKIARSDEWRDLSRATYKAASDASNFLPT
jgi:hypothetical protein